MGGVDQKEKNRSAKEDDRSLGRHEKMPRKCQENGLDLRKCLPLSFSPRSFVCWALCCVWLSPLYISRHWAWWSGLVPDLDFW